MASINGTFGNDILIGTPETDSIFGDLGDDTLIGGDDDEFVFNNVIDVLVFDSGVYVYSSDGFDIIKNFSRLSGEDDNVISIDPVNNKYTYVSINTSLSVRNTDVVSPGKIESIDGTTGSDTIQGTSADEIIYGLEGNDVLYGNGGYDILYGEPGNDSLYGGGNANRLYGGLGNDYLNGGDNGGNVLYGEKGDDILEGDGGLDVLIGGIGNDTYIIFVFGSEGNVVINQFANQTRIFQITEYLNEGTDTVESSFSYKLGDNLENLVLTGSEDINGIGNALDNRIEGNAGYNFLVGDDGNDHLLGYGDYDILVGGAGNDTLVGGAGNDFLNGGSGSDFLNGGTGNNTLTGDAGADTFVFNFKSEGIDIIKDFSYLESDKIQTSTIGFGATSTNEFSYDSKTGALSFQQGKRI
ncbi:calcium-binding protein [Nostoc sp. FACHB-888]|uniref:calcium-binding protein n=1 Tax=Nostoc sp. FACHB-888 TaxID=2692842 RepID=UPI00168A35E4|nr:calcium-binding protein [Nostoc sp. FACHB-888]MBD2249604.1 hypothetical protein [Nostoc sp. FACHB-888]